MANNVDDSKLPLERDVMSVQDRASRRQFIRSGSVFVAAAAVVVAAPSAYATDCDRQGGEKNAEDEGSDSDAGATADAAGCGQPVPPKITRRSQPVQNSGPAVIVSDNSSANQAGSYILGTETKFAASKVDRFKV